jgi:hypothetical protein
LSFQAEEYLVGDVYSQKLINTKINEATIFTLAVRTQYGSGETTSFHMINLIANMQFRFVALTILINNFSSIINLRGLMRNMKPKKIGIQQKNN